MISQCNKIYFVLKSVPEIAFLILILSIEGKKNINR
jgi:hypothetical protein